MKTSRILPPAIFLLYLLLTLGLHFILPIMQLMYSPYTYCGVLFIGFGIWLNVWADALFKKIKTTVKPFEKTTALVLAGPFRFSRHPMYLGMVSVLLGTAVILGSLIAFFTTIVFFIHMNIVFVPYEEKALQDTFGQKYLDYKKRVRRWL